MFEFVKKILDTGKEQNVSLDFAKDRLVASGEDEKKLGVALILINKFYETVTKCRRFGDNDTIQKLIGAYEEENHEMVDAIVEEVKNRAE